jgi:hypothetical protein
VAATVAGFLEPFANLSRDGQRASRTESASRMLCVAGCRLSSRKLARRRRAVDRLNDLILMRRKKFCVYAPRWAGVHIAGKRWDGKPLGGGRALPRHSR